MKMRKNIELIAILMAVLAACLFTACDGGAMEELWKDELENGNVPVSERIVTDEGAVIISETFEIQRNAEQEVTIAASPASVTEGAENITTIKFPAGSFGSSGETVTETIKVVVYPTSVAAAKFTVSSESAVAGLDLTVTVNDVPVTTFNNQVVKVTTYIAKKLTNVGIHYENENWTQVAQETDVDATREFFYDSTTGKLIFGTTHFSQFLLSADEVAYVESNQTAYLNLSDAIKSATDDDTVVLLKDYSYASNGVGLWNITKSMTFDGNGKTLSGYGVRGTNNTTLAINNGCTEESPMIDVTLKNLTINNSGSYGRPIETRGNIGTINFDNVTINATGDEGNPQCLTIGASQDTSANININDSTFNAGSDGYPVITYNPIYLRIENSCIEGYCGVYFKAPNSSAGSFGSVLTATNSTFDAPNLYDGYTNGFGVFVMETDVIKINLTDCNVNGKCHGTADQTIFYEDSWLEPSDESVPNEYNVYGDSTTINGDIFDETYDYNFKSRKWNLTAGVYKEDPSAYVAEGYKAVDNGDGTWTVSSAQPE